MRQRVAGDLGVVVRLLPARELDPGCERAARALADARRDPRREAVRRPADDFRIDPGRRRGTGAGRPAGAEGAGGEDVDDLPGRVAASVRVARASHRRVRVLVGEQRRRPALERPAVGADQHGVAGVDALGALRRPADHDHGLAERRHLLLETAGVGDHEVAAPEQPDHRLIVERVEQADVRHASERAVNRLAHLRAAVDRDHDLHLRMTFGDGPEPQAHVFERLRRHLAPVHGRHDHALAVEAERRERCPIGLERHPGHGLESVDHRVPGDVDPVLRDALPVEVLGARRPRREMDVREHARDTPVHLLGPRIVLVERPQTGLDVADLPALLERSERAGHGRRRVALDEHPVGMLLLENRAEPVDDRDRDVVQRLGVLHHVQVVIRPDLEQVEHLVEHLPMLAGHADPRLEHVRPPLELPDDGRELDRLRTRAEDSQNLDHWPGLGRIRRQEGHTGVLRRRF